MNETTTKRTSIWDYANPTRFMGIADKLIPWLAGVTILCISAGLYLGFTAPEDYQQGSTVQILFIHVPSAWIAMMCYGVMTASAIGTLVWRHPLADISLRAAAPIGAAFTFLGLFTGALWGKPMWGTYWVWDARLTSFLVLLIIYLGIIALSKAIEEPTIAARSLAIVTLIGSINLPIIKFSVDWWNTLHQPASVSRLAKPALDAVFLYPLLLMALGYSLLFLTLHLMNMRNEILKRRIRTMKMNAARQAERA